MQRTRWLFYAVNGEGLGHLTRQLALARHVRQARPGDEFLFLTSSEASHIAWQEGFASLKLPSLNAIEHTGLQRDSYLRLLNTTLPAAVAGFAPDVMVVDTFPTGLQQELMPLLQWPLRRVLVAREVDAALHNSPGFQYGLAHYHLLLVPEQLGQEGLVMPARLSRHYVGEILLRSREESLSRAEARQRLGLPAEGTLVYVGFGGGGDAAYADVLRWVLEQAVRFPGLYFACAVPPLRRHSGFWGSLPNVSLFHYWPLAECWAAFDGAISAAGYNSFAELMHHGIPTLWVPLAKKAEDQSLRAQRAAAQGAGWQVAAGDSAALHAALQALQQPALRHAMSERAKRLVPVNGAARAATLLLG